MRRLLRQIASGIKRSAIRPRSRICQCCRSCATTRNRYLLPLSEGRSPRAEGVRRERCNAYRSTKTKAPLVVVQRHRIRSAKLLVDSLQHSIDLGQHFVIPEANDSISADLNQPGAPRILRCLLQMLPTIKLDRQLRARTCEVGDEIRDGKLPPKSKITESSRAQTCPELGLCICLVTAQYACAMMQYWNRFHILSAVTDCAV